MKWLLLASSVAGARSQPCGQETHQATLVLVQVQVQVQVQVRGSRYCTVLAVGSVQISQVHMWWCGNDVMLYREQAGRRVRLVLLRTDAALSPELSSV